MPEVDDASVAPESAARSEGVRILGAEEAQAAVDGSDPSAPARGPPRRRRSAPPDDVQPAARFPLPADRLPGEDARPDDAEPARRAARREPIGSDAAPALDRAAHGRGAA